MDASDRIRMVEGTLARQALNVHHDTLVAVLQELVRAQQGILYELMEIKNTIKTEGIQVKQ